MKNDWRIAYFDSKKSEKSLKETLRELQRELKEAKADALDSLNNQAEAISELQARAVPDGWEIERVTTHIGAAWVRVEMLSTLSTIKEKWVWTTYVQGKKKHDICANRTTSEGFAMTFNEAVQQAEKAGKKVKR